MTTSFRRYDHLERLGHDDVAGITSGLVYVFPKLDGTCSAAWHRDDGIECASRNRVLSIEDDNQGFCAWALGDSETAEALRDLMVAWPSWIIYGEWMVPHTLKTYRPETWRRFWIFDVFDVGLGKYLPWWVYGLALANTGLNVIEPLCTIKDPSEAQLRATLETNTYLIADGAGLGEGVVVKNYAWANTWGRQPWAKIVRTVFKEEAQRTHGTTHKHGEFQVEVAIADKYCTPELVGKTRAKVVAAVANDVGIDLAANPNAQRLVEEGNRHRVIPQLLGRVFHDLVTEKCWAFIREHKNPTVDFNKLRGHIIAKVKEYAGDLF